MADGNSSHTAPIHILDDDSILNIFYFYRPVILGYDDDGFRIVGGQAGWERERWWYDPAQVCQRWRNLLLGSASYLDLCLACTNGTPVADMLAHSPPLPLVIDSNSLYWPNVAENEEGIILALEKRDRVRRVRLARPVPDLQKLIMAIDEEYPVLEYLIVESPTVGASPLMLPEALQAPHLHHLSLKGVVPPTGSRLFTTAVGLVTLSLVVGHPSTYFQPNVLLHWLSLMPQLETLLISFSFPVPNRDVERQLLRTPTTTHVTLSNLRWFEFQGVSAYMEAILRRITAPRLERLGIFLFKQLTFSIPRFVQFMNTAENLRFNSAKFKFYRDGVGVYVYLREQAKTYPLQMGVYCLHLDWQVSFAAQIFNSLTQVSSAVEHLTLKHKAHSRSSEEHNEVDRAEWRKLLTSFSNAKTLRVGDGLIKEISRSLRLEDGEHSLELLPELQELTYSGSDDEFKSFIDARQAVGCPVTLVRPSPKSVTPLS